MNELIRKKNIFYTVGMLLLYGISFLTIRLKYKWVFGSNLGYSNNAKYLFIYMSENCPEKSIWIGSKEEVAFVRKQGYRANYRWSLSGLFHCLTAYVYVFNSYTSDINVYATGVARRVNLWHGVGIKNIERAVNIGSLYNIFHTNNLNKKFLELAHFLRPHFFLSTSPLMTKHFCKCFDIKSNNCYEGSYPRCEIFKWSEDKLKKFIKHSEGKDCEEILMQIKRAQKTFLYMPTWRDSNQDFMSESNFNFELLNNTLSSNNQLFILKLHPLTLRYINSGKEYRYSNIIFINENIDIYPILPFTDVLITDYSSIYYDYLLLNDKKTILYIFDYEDYIKNSRDLAFCYDECTTGKKVKTFEELMDLLTGKVEIPTCNDERTKIIEKFWDIKSEKNIEELYDSIKKMTYK